MCGGADLKGDIFALLCWVGITPLRMTVQGAFSYRVTAPIPCMRGPSLESEGVRIHPAAIDRAADRSPTR
jgi:hypothetical protein